MVTAHHLYCRMTGLSTTSIVLFRTGFFSLVRFERLKACIEIPNLWNKKVLFWCHLSNCNIYTGKSAYPNRINPWCPRFHYDDVIMTMLASQITSLAVVYSIVYSGVDQRKHQSSASLAFVREIYRGPVNFPQKWPVTRKIFPFDDVIMLRRILADQQNQCCYLAPFC